MCKCFAFFVTFFVISTFFADGEYVTYVRKGNKFEPVMEPVSSTIEPIPIYKLARKMNMDDNTKYDKNTLLTVFNINGESKKLEYYNGNEKEKQLVKIEPAN